MPMSAQKKESSINLLPEQELSGTTRGRLLLWVLSTFRAIVIVTEIIVMIAFVSRFWLDAQNTDLSEEIDAKKKALEATTAFEGEFRKIQNKLLIYGEVTKADIDNGGLLRKLTNYLPPDAVLTKILVNHEGGSLEIEGISSNEISVKQYIVNLQSTGDFEEVSLMDIRSDLENVNILVYKIGATFKKLS